MKYIMFRKLSDSSRGSIPVIVHKYIPGFELLSVELKILGALSL